MFKRKASENKTISKTRNTVDPSKGTSGKRKIKEE
jgi:hypothetical protein